jgi:hypothetical protein
MATNNAQLRNGAAVVILNPEHAMVYRNANMDREAIQNALHGYCVQQSAELKRLAGGFAPKGAHQGPVHAFRDQRDILVLVAGGTGLYSMVMPTWCAGPHVNRFVTRKVELNAFCEITLPPAG